MIIGLVCLVIQIILSVQIFQRKDLDIVGKLVMALIVILVPYMIGAAFYYFYAKDKAAQWFKKQSARQSKCKSARLLSRSGGLFFFD